MKKKFKLALHEKFKGFNLLTWKTYGKLHFFIIAQMNSRDSDCNHESYLASFPFSVNNNLILIIMVNLISQTYLENNKIIWI